MRKTNLPEWIIIILSFMAIGASLGWLVGIALSPVLNIVVGSVLTIVISFISLLIGTNTSPVEKEAASENNKINAKLNFENKFAIVPIAIFFTSLAIGASYGVIYRTNDKLGLNPDLLINKWIDDPAKRAKIKEELFRKKYLDSESAITQNQFAAGLFGFTESDCQLLEGRAGAALKANLLLVSNGKIDSLINSCGTEKCLLDIRDSICAYSK